MEKKKTSLAKLCPKGNKALEGNWAGRRQASRSICLELRQRTLNTQNKISGVKMLSDGHRGDANREEL